MTLVPFDDRVGAGEPALAGGTLVPAAGDQCLEIHLGR